MKNTRKCQRVNWEKRAEAEKRSSSSPQFPLVLFSCLRLFYFAEPTISEPGTGHLFPSLWPQGDDGNFSTCTENFLLLKQTLIKHQTLFQCIKTAIVFWLPWKHWLRMDFVILWTYIHHKKKRTFSLNVLWNSNEHTPRKECILKSRAIFSNTQQLPVKNTCFK